MIRPGGKAGCLVFGGYRAVTEGYPKIGLGNFDPWNFFLISGGIRRVGVQVDGGAGQKN
jgi:hypothetical protein